MTFSIIHPLSVQVPPFNFYVWFTLVSLEYCVVVSVHGNKNAAYTGLAFSIRRRQRGRVVRALDLQFGSLEFKSHPNHRPDLFTVVLRSNPPASWDS